MSNLIAFKQKRGYAYQIKKQGTLIMLTEGCESTNSCSGGCGSCGGKKHGRTVLVNTESSNPLHLGTKVIVKFPEINELAGALIVFGIPLTGALLSLFLWYHYAPTLVESGYSIISAGASFVVGFLIVRLIDGVFRKKFPSQIVSIETPSQATTQQSTEQNTHG